MGLDARGDVSVIQVVLYAPILIVSVMLAVRHGLGRREGWISLFVLSLMRVIGGIMHAVADAQSKPSLGLVAAYSVLETIGLGPLLVATLGFSRTIARSTKDEQPILPPQSRVLGLLSGVAVLVTIIGGIHMGEAHDQGTLNTGEDYRRAGSVLFMVLYAALVLVNVFLWTQRSRIQTTRLMLLSGVSAALPFVFTRVLYGLLGAWASLTLTTTSTGEIEFTSNGVLGQFSIFTGSWPLYFAMSVLTEYAAVLIYVLVGLKTPALRGSQGVPIAQPTPQQSWAQRRWVPPSQQAPVNPNWDAESQAETVKGAEAGYAKAF